MKLTIDMKKVYFFAGIIGFVVIFAVGSILCLPLQKNISENRSKQLQYSSEADFMKGILGNVKPEEINVVLPSRAQASSVTDALIKTGEKYNIDFVSLRPSTKDDTRLSTHDRLFFEMSASATFKELGEFFTAVRTLPVGILDVESMVLTAVKNDPKRVDANIVLTLLVVKGDAEK